MEPMRFAEHYLRLEPLGASPLAQRYRARRTGPGPDTGADVTLEVLAREACHHPGAVAVFSFPGFVAAASRHPNLERCLERGEAEGTFFLAWERPEARPLADVLTRSWETRRRLPVPTAIALVLQCARGLQHLHERTDPQGASLELVHRDVHPMHVSVGVDGVCRVGGFRRVATRLSAHPKAAPPLGRLAYTAPELLQGKVAMPAADVYTLGVLLYELTVGRRLFAGTRDQVAQAVLSGDVPPPTFVTPGFPPALEPILMKALERDPQKRTSSCAALVADLLAFVEEQPTPTQVAQHVAALFRPGSQAGIGADERRSEDPWEDLRRDEDADLTLEAIGSGAVPVWAVPTVFDRAEGPVLPRVARPPVSSDRSGTSVSVDSAAEHPTVPEMAAVDGSGRDADDVSAPGAPSMPAAMAVSAARRKLASRGRASLGPLQGVWVFILTAAGVGGAAYLAYTLFASR